MNDFSFGRLEAYREARKLVVEVYRIAAALPKCEDYALGAQLRRAIVSVPSNIAEGCGRISLKEKAHFLEIAYGSLLEAFCQLEICRDLNYITNESITELKPKFHIVSRLINALHKSYQNKITQRPN